VLLFVAMDAHVADARVRQQAQEALDHAEAGAQHGHDCNLVAQPDAARRLERRVDGDLIYR